MAQAESPLSGGAQASELGQVSLESIRERARELAAAGFASLDAAEYSRAVTLFSEAIRLYDVPTLRVGRGDAYGQLNRLLEASADYLAAANYPLQPSDSVYIASSRASAVKKLVELGMRIPRVRVDTSAGQVEVAVDGRPSAKLAASNTLKLNPGSHRIVITTPDGSVTHEVVVNAGEVLILDGPKPKLPRARLVPLQERVQPAPVEHAPPHSEEVTTEVVVAGAATGVLALAWATTGLIFRRLDARYREQYLDKQVPFETKQRRYAELEVLGQVNTGLLVGAAVAAGVTSYFWLAPQRGPTVGQEEGAAWPPNGWMAGLSGSF